MSSGKNNGGLNSNDLDSLNHGKFDHSATLGGNGDSGPRGPGPQAPDDLRSVKSEYDYGAKKKFVDILGNLKKNNLDGLKGLDGLQGHPGMKNLEQPLSTKSGRSGMSRRSNFPTQTPKVGKIAPIDEGAEIDMNLVDKDGNPIVLTPE